MKVPNIQLVCETNKETGKETVKDKNKLLVFETNKNIKEKNARKQIGEVSNNENMCLECEAQVPHECEADSTTTNKKEKKQEVPETKETESTEVEDMDVDNIQQLAHTKPEGVRRSNPNEQAKKPPKPMPRKTVLAKPSAKPL